VNYDDDPISRHPLHAWLATTGQGLEALRLALIGHHQEAFEPAADPCIDPSNWMARAVEANLDALIRTMTLYEQAVRVAEELEEMDF
jgi:hypothetical protein